MPGGAKTVQCLISRWKTAGKGKSMYVVAVTVFVKPEQVDLFIRATLDNARNTRREPGNLRFDVLQAEDDPTRFLLYEAYRAKDDFAKHQQTEHYLRWKETVADAMAQPRQGIKHNSLFFGDGES
jgi:autoinducer 2-degrading protein